MMNHSATQSTIKSIKPQYYLKNPSSIPTLKSTHNPTSSSPQSQKSGSKKFFSNGVKLSSSYYNDRQNIYVKRSRMLSEKSLSYQSKEISFSERRKYNQRKIQGVVSSRAKGEGRHGEAKIERDRDRVLSNKTMSLPSMDRLSKQTIRTRMNSLNAKKFSQLIHNSQPTKHKINLLNKEITKKRQQINRQIKWSSPFRDTNTFKAKFQGKNFIPRKVNGIIANSNPNQLKVLNIDRMFRVKNGKLGNVVPLPVPKLSEISSRQQVAKSIKKKDTIHDIIDEYNKLLKQSQQKPAKIAIKGKNFTKSPTLQQLMGIKIHHLHKTPNNPHLNPNHNSQQLNQDIFLQYNQFYQKQMKKDIHLARRLVMGLRQDGKFDLEAFTRFYGIFVNRVASLQEKIRFLLYFFIPANQQKIQLGILKLILQLMCEQLPQIHSLKTESEFLSKQQKSKIFLEALNRVLFADLKQFTGQGEVLINRNILEVLLQRNQDAVGLLVRLLLLE